MNKRQRKKREKIINERLEFFSKIFINIGRRNGKTQLYEGINKAIYSKHHQPFKILNKKYKNMLIAVDWGNRKDYSVKTTAKRIGNSIKILKVEVID